MQELIVAVIVAWSVAVLVDKYLPAALRARLNAHLAAGLRALCAQSRRFGLPGLAARLDARAALLAGAPVQSAGACGGCSGCAAPQTPKNSISVDALKRTIRR